MKKRKKEKWHKSKGTNNTSINHDSVMLSDKGDPDFEGDAGGDFEGDADGDNSDNDIDLFEESDTKKQKPKIGQCTKTDDQGGQPIPFFFCPNLTDEELKGMVDEHGNIRFSKIYEWMLPTFEGVSFYEFLSARMCNFMLRHIKIKGWTPMYYHPADKKVISADNVVRKLQCDSHR